MFVDETYIKVVAGSGGNGKVAFRHEKYVPNGGPAGGDGGKGGDIIAVADPGLKTLMDFKYRRKFKAEKGEDGQIKSMYGHGGKDLILQVPIGTIIKDANTHEILGDLTHAGQKVVVATGGRGGRGNIHFATSTHQAPEVAENGEPGQERELYLEMKLLADVGLVGFPSVGKSTFLSVVTSAKPKIAAYAFTTLRPNLGVLQFKDGRELVIADLPGIIEGASTGVGLGLVFLRHIERTRVLVHLVDLDPENGRDAFEDFEVIEAELKTYGEDVANKPTIVVGTKSDLPGAAEKLAQFKQSLTAKYGDRFTVYEISNQTHKGIDDLVAAMFNELSKVPRVVEEKNSALKHVDYKFTPEEEGFKITKLDEGRYELESEKVIKLLDRSNLDYYDGVMRFARSLRKMGVDEALRNFGVQDGDTVVIKDFELEFRD
ncbi:GTPase ObgE [Xylocopilactobacillus apicola]|uniref:GTPase Obg n=1 Tax=Xylocopilactobacillus apicola TaxID=2932184 RepID=A0AAU9D346_9LACO|nr:GTPase ObgE [Xylocopilactobacillus apicola]BDR59241.1 GTPase Obg [Xylocopilactobacillus apicola]